MKLAEFSVNRRVTIFIITVLIIIMGGISFFRLGLEIFPDMDYPVISIVTPYYGASPQDVEETVTETIETAIASVKNIKTIKSESLENASLIMVEFNWGANLDFAAQDLRDVIDQITDYLPDDVSRPLVMKFNLSQMPILMYGVTGAENTYELRKILEDEISTKLKHLKGVGTVMIYGGDELEKQIIVDKEKIEQYNISIDDIVQIVAAGNLNMSAGHIQKRKDEYLLRTMAQYKSIEEINNLPIKFTKTGKTIYLKDVASVQDGFKERRNRFRTNKTPTAMIIVAKESGANTLTVTDLVKKEVVLIEEEFKDDLEFYMVMDMGLPISRITSGAVSNLIVGGILAIAIMFLFLRNWRPTLAISLAIPISVVATFIPIYLANFTLNIMTLGGLALGVGMLVDNSIVVIENIYRHLEMGKKKFQAAKVGASEVAMAITASTLTTIAVFFPMIFAEGMTGILVRGLALTVAFSLAASLFVSLTIVPVIASIIFRKAKDRPQVDRSKTFFEGIKNRYKKILIWGLAHKTKTLIIVGVLFLLTLLIPIFGIIGTEFMPERDIPFMVLNVKMPTGTPLDESDAVIKQLEDVFLETEGVMNVMAMVGPMSDAQALADPTNPQEVNESQVFVRLHEQSDRDLTYKEIQEQVRKKLPKVEGAEFNFMSSEEMMGGGGAKPIEVSIYGKDLDKLKEISMLIEKRMNKVEHVTDVVNSMKEGKPEYHIVIDKDKAFKYGLTATQIASSIKTSSLGTLCGIFRKSGEEIDITVRLEEEKRNSFEDIMHFSIISPMGFSVPLNQIAHLEPAEGPRKITHEKQSRKVLITASVTGTNDMGGTVKNIQTAIADIEENLPSGYYLDFGGAYEDMQEAFVTLGLALLLAIILVYSVMASQFESLRQPFIVMFTMPLAIIGVMLILGITGTTLSVVSFVGVIILAGIVVNNGIVLIDHINQLRMSGMVKYEAILQGGMDRLRPVLITALTTIGGMLPMAISSGEGSELKSPMALTVIGGLISATFLTLIVIPIIYSIIAKRKKRIEE
ncbi:MAG: efflux RND transporter permease subunit [Candidatus Cloacimonetes bacterium]|nr:efflux RND transporter permease subunit [Candidatus Cloacimonadota bacterium]